MNQRTFLLAEQRLAELAEDPNAAPLDKRIVQLRHRRATLIWLARFGWLTNRMLASLRWSHTSQPEVMARRTLTAMVDDNLVISRPLNQGGTAYLLSAKGARLLQEETGLEARSGNSLSIGNPIHRASSNWYLIRAWHQGMSIVTEHEIVTERGPCRVLSDKVADGLAIADGGACVWLECENAYKSRAERLKTTGLVEDCIGGETQVELAPGLYLARVAIVATNERALASMAESFRDAHRLALLTESQVANVVTCLLPISESLIPGVAVDENMWWDKVLPPLLSQAQ